MSAPSYEELMRMLEEEKARGDAERTRADAADARAEAAAKENFFTAMRSISSSASADTTSRTDTARRGAPEAEFEEGGDVLRGAAPDVDEGAVRAAWAVFLARHAASWRPPPAAAKLKENRHVHPTVGWLLDAVVPRGALRVWHDEPAPDDVKRAHVRPDFTVTLARDAAPSTIGAVLFVEVKKPRDIVNAAYQACAYARRRVFKLCCEADARGEPLDGIFSLCAATDGEFVVLARVASGAPPRGESFSGAVPCPTRQSEPLPLLGGWDFRSPPAFAAEPPDGFRALWRLCSSPAALGGGSPLEALRVALSSAAGGAPESTLTLGERLGCGGTSDVYDCGGGCVAKVSRVATRQVAAEFAAERDALDALGDAAAAGLVPACVDFGARVPDGARARAGDAAGASPWPVLVLRPRGVPLAQWVAARVAEAARAAGEGGAAAAAAAAAAARLACADAVVRRLLDALAAAGRAGLVHCDVRPSNVVVAEGGAALVDWGISRAAGARLKGCGVAAFADARVFQSGAGVAAAPAVDALAALFTWLAVAFGDGCAAPWGQTRGLEDVFRERVRWVREAAEGGGRAAAVAAGIAALSEREAAGDAVDVARACLFDGAGAGGGARAH